MQEIIIYITNKNNIYNEKSLEIHHRITATRGNTHSCSKQSPKRRRSQKFQYEIGYQFSLGLSERSNGETFHRSDIDMDGNAVKIAALYNFNRRISAGLGLSFVGYDPNPNSLPPYAILRYRPLDGKWNNLYAFTNLGYSLGKSGSEDLCSGFAGELGIGWQMHLYKRLGLNFGISYGLNQFNKLNATGIYGDESNLATPSKLTRKDVWRNSLNFSVALVF